MVGTGPLASSPIASSSALGVEENEYGFRREVVSRDQREINRQESPEVHLVFLTISHPELAEPIRVVTDTKNYVYDGVEYTGFMFDIELLSDSDGVPRARLAVQNVDKLIGEVILGLVTPPRLKFSLIPASYFDLTVVPRVELETPVPISVADELYLTDVDVDAMTVSGNIRSWDYSQETWPGRRATQNRAPGLFR